MFYFCGRKVKIFKFKMTVTHTKKRSDFCTLSPSPNIHPLTGTDSNFFCFYKVDTNTENYVKAADVGVIGAATNAATVNAL